MEQRCFNQHGMGIYTVVTLSKDKDQNSRFTKHEVIPIKEKGTYHHNEKLIKEMPGFLSPGKGVPLLLIPEYSGINKGQRAPDRSIAANGKPPVKCFLTAIISSECSLFFKKQNITSRAKPIPISIISPSVAPKSNHSPELNIYYFCACFCTSTVFICIKKNSTH